MSLTVDLFFPVRRLSGLPRKRRQIISLLLSRELTQRIGRLAIHQAWMDVLDKERKLQVLDELKQYHCLRQAWELGPLKLHHGQGAFLEIWAEHRDVEDNRLCEAFLGSGKGQKAWYQALPRVNHVKSFL